MTTEEYCRQIEAHLCRKNDGHLIRLVGPSFERVRGWATQGVPFKIACQGIDQYFVRYYAKGPRRRPVQVDFCEADVLDAFDAWRRAIGVRLPGAEASGQETEAKRRKRSLRAHLDRVCERVTARRAGSEPPPPDFDRALETVALEAAAFRDVSAPIRGEERDRVQARLVELDRLMIDAARAHTDPASLATMRAEAVAQLSAFHDRMPAEAYQNAIEAAIDRLVRDREKLPEVTFA